MQPRTYILAGVVLGGAALLFGLGRGEVEAPTSLPGIIREYPRSAEPSRDAELLFVGDVMLSREIGAIMTHEGDYAYPFHRVRDELASADVLFGNLESPISDQGSNVGSIYSFRADPRAVEGLRDAGFDVLSFANNHVGDYGPRAITDTLDRLSVARIRSVGAGRSQEEAHTPAVIEVNGLRVAFLAYTNIAPAFYLASEASPAVANIVMTEIRGDIARAKNVYNADLVVVSYHWGEEYQIHRNEWQARIGRQTIDAGATFVIGHHPHVVQEVERYNGGVIAYSLGNFVFDQNFSPDTQKGLALRVRIKGGALTDIAELPVAFTSTYQPYFKTDIITN